MNPQGVGTHYQKQAFLNAQNIGWQLLENLRGHIQVGQTEEQVRHIYSSLMPQFGIEKNWHAPKIRFGPNTTKAFHQKSDEDYQLQSGDLFFIDLGPIIDGYEVDVGRTFLMSTQSDSQDSTADSLSSLKQKALQDSPWIFEKVKQHFHEKHCSGPELYAFAEKLAAERGWQLIDEGANGHRVGDFPHHVYYKGSLKEFSSEELIPELWILEIQIANFEHSIGAFTEDTLS